MVAAASSLRGRRAGAWGSCGSTGRAARLARAARGRARADVSGVTPTTLARSDRVRARTSPASRDDVRATSRSSSTGATPFQRRRRPRRCGASRTARRSTYGELARARRPSERAARGRDRSARTTASRSSSRATASSPPTGSARTARSASTTSGGCWSSKVSFSEDLRARARGDRAGARVRPARRALGALPLRGQRCTCAAAARSSVHLDLVEPGGRAARVQRSCARSASARRSAPTGGARSTGDALPAPRRGRRPRAARCCSEAGVVDARLAPLERPPQRVVAPRVLPRARTCAARCSAAARSAAPRVAAPRGPQRRAATGAEFARRDRRAARARRCASSTAAACGRLREGHRADRGRARRSPARATRRSRSRSARSCGDDARARTGSRTPTTRTSSARAAPPTRSSQAVAPSRASGRLDELSPQLQRDRASCGSAPVAVAARARRQVRSAGDEGRGPACGCNAWHRSSSCNRRAAC